MWKLNENSHGTDAGYSIDDVRKARKPKLQKPEEKSLRVTHCEQCPLTSPSPSFWYPIVSLHPGCNLFARFFCLTYLMRAYAVVLIHRLDEGAPSIGDRLLRPSTSCLDPAPNISELLCNTTQKVYSAEFLRNAIQLIGTVSQSTRH
jgi:hypothetical protein